MTRVSVLAIVALTAFAQSNDISDRIRTAFASVGSSELASTALANHDFARIEQMLSQLTPVTPAERSEVLALRGAVEFLDGKMSAAVGDFQKASEVAPLRDSDRFTLAMALVNFGDDTHARQLLNALAEKYPERAIYVYWLGRLDYSQRRYLEAVEKLKKAAELDSQSPRVWDSLGLAFDMQGRMDEAADVFKKAVNLNRAMGHPSPWPPHDLGFLLLRMDRLREAEALLRESLRYDSHLAEAHYHLGRTLEKESRNEEAIQEYRNAVSADTTSTDACYSLAMLYRNLHRDTEATGMFAEYKKRREAALTSTASQSEPRP